MKPEDVIADRYPSICVAFIRLSGTSAFDYDEHTALPTPVHRTPFNSHRASLVDGAKRFSLPAATTPKENTTDEPLHIGSPLNGSTATTQPPASVGRFSSQASMVSSNGPTPSVGVLSASTKSDIKEQMEWLDGVHTKVDEVIRRSRNVDKIKTIGSDMMIAGSFYPECSPGIAALEILDVIFEIKTIVDASAGVHVGELVAAVLGSSRLCFDVFGDTVNVASRAMTGGGKRGEVTVTSDFFALHSAALREDGKLMSGKLPRPLTFSQEIQRAAKGRGVISVRTVIDGETDKVM